MRTQCMIEEILPDGVVAVETRGDDPLAFLFPEEAAQLGAAVEGRIREFTTGRTCARRALAKLGFPRVPILRGPNREPIWPQGVVGSLTHCDGYRAAAVGLQRRFLAIGIDAEIAKALPEGVAELVCGDEERAWWAEAPEGIHWDLVQFSAKESVFKACFPLTGCWLDFQDASVTFEPERGLFHVRIRSNAPALARHRLTGRFLVRDGLVLTAVVLAPPTEGTAEAQVWYNRQRRHSSLGYVSPAEFERQALAGAARATDLSSACA